MVRTEPLFEFVDGVHRDGGKSLSRASVNQRSIAVRFDAIASEEAKEIEIPLFDRTLLHAVQRETEGFIRHNVESFSWSGRIIRGDEWAGDVVLSVYQNAMAGSIRTPSGIYSILPQANGSHVLQQIDQSAFPDDTHDAQIVPSFLARPEAADAHESESPSLDDGSQIDVLIVYSSFVRSGLGGTAQANAFAQQAIAVTNTAYQNSAIGPRLRLVHAMELPYVESGNALTDLKFIRTNQDVAIARDLYQADAVAFLVTYATNSCGIAYLMSASSHNSDFGAYAFSVSVSSCAIDNLTFPHELGHNQGADHNPENASIPPSEMVYPYAFGHYVDGGASPFRTVLSTTSNGICWSCPRIPYFSNPNVNYAGQPTGIMDQRDNARTISNTALVFSRFRNSALAIADLQSRKLHDGTAYNLDLRPGAAGVESRSGGAAGNHQILVTFANAVTVGGVSVSSSDGQATATSTVDGAVVTIDLAAVANAQTLGVTLTDVSTGPHVGNVFFPFKVLVGDSNGDTVVNSGDAQQTRNRSGQTTNAANFRSDSNLDGVINSGDATVVRSRSGQFIP